MDDFVRKPKKPIINLDQKSSNIAHTDTAIQSTADKIGNVPNNNSDNHNPSAASDNKINKPTTSRKAMNIKKIKLPVPKTKLQWILAITTIILLLAGTVLAVYLVIIKEAKPAATYTPPVEEQVVVDPGPQPIYSKVSGRLVEESINSRPVYAVQIENSPEARPQSGLIDADIVSEAIAEGGITRFNAIFHDKTPASIGPIRSLRPYFIDWFMPYDAAIVHAGGSAEALAEIASLRLKDIDHGNSSSIFKRSTSRYAPHNLYTTGAQVTELMTQRGYISDITKSLERKDFLPSETPSATNIAINISRGLYNVNFSYDKASNTYLRSQGGIAHIDADSKKQIAPDVVIVPVVGRQPHPNRVHNIYSTTGTGKVFVFQDGNVVEGTWSKESRQSQWEIKDEQGNIIKLNGGQRWFSIVESADRVSYSQ